jgi:dihydroorotate dehydrogenase (NAD+) catalytic subunit
VSAPRRRRAAADGGAGAGAPAGAAVAVDAAVDLGGIALRNPVLTASGTFGYGTELAPFLDLRRIGGFVAKSLTLEPRRGNPPPRIAETPSGMLNAISLENVGVDVFVRDKLPALPEGVVVVASVFETEVDRYAEVAKRLSGVPRVAGIEVNASCPHVKSGGIEFGQSPEALRGLVRATRRATSLPLLVKLSPNVTDIGEMARVCEGEGASGISLINSVQALEVDVERRRPVLSNVLGGLSGPAIRPIALRMVWQARRAVSLPICGVGGITCAEDAVKFLLCGATAVQVGTQNYLDPGVAGEVAEGLVAYARRHGFARLADLVGALDTGAR